MNILIEMTLSAALLITVVIIIRALFIHKLPKRAFVAMWAVVVLRLLVPFSFTVNLPAETAQADTTQQTQQAPSDAKIYAPQADVQPVSSFDCKPLLEIAWASGCAVTAMVISALHFRCKKEYKTALPLGSSFVKNRVEAAGLRRRVIVKFSDKISSPLTYGVLNPVILLPKSLCNNENPELELVLAHELTHIRRFDVVKKFVLAIAVCLHWFNPLVWAMYVLANRDIELSCDEMVIKQMGFKKSDYATALIKLEESRSVSPAISGFSRNAVRERIEAIMKLRKTSVLSILVSACLLAGATTVFATVENTEKPAESTEDYIAMITNEASAISSEIIDGFIVYSSDEEINKTNYDLYKELEPHGVTHDEQDNVYFDEKTVRIIAEKEQDSSSELTIEYMNPEGEIDLYIIRDANGIITGVEKCSKDEFDSTKIAVVNSFGNETNTFQSQTTNNIIHGSIQFAQQISDLTDASDNVETCVEGGEWDGDFLSDYFDFGLSANDERECFFFNGKTVAGFVDSGYHLALDGVQAENGGIYVAAVREGEKIVGLEEITKAEFDEIA